jgi:hypothetical protein
MCICLKLAVVLLASISTLAAAEEINLVRDLDAQGKEILSQEDLNQLIPKSTFSRVSAAGNTQIWTNDVDGTFIVSSNNIMSKTGIPSTAPGKWHISEDGRYCVLIEWKTVTTEEWCRYLIKSGDSYFATKSVKTGTEKVYKLKVSK